MIDPARLEVAIEQLDDAATDAATVECEGIAGRLLEILSELRAIAVEAKPDAWAIEYAPGELLRDDYSVCVYYSKAKAEQQADWQWQVKDAWDGIRLVPVFIGELTPPPKEAKP